MALSCKQHKILLLQMEKNGLRQAEKLKNQKSSLRAGKGKRQVVTYGGVSWRQPLVPQRMNACLVLIAWAFFTLDLDLNWGEGHSDYTLGTEFPSF